MASIEKDSVSGQMTTGHEWDGIKELNTPLPKWWVWVFWVSVLWSVGYWWVYPSWPTFSGAAHTQGAGLGSLVPSNWTSRTSLDADLKQQTLERSPWVAKIKAATLDDIFKDKTLRDYAVAGGQIAFRENCAACHGAGGSGVPGAYPNLTDDVWLWGGTLADIEQTITHGVRNEDQASRGAGGAAVMPSFGADKNPHGGSDWPGCRLCGVVGGQEPGSRNSRRGGVQGQLRGVPWRGRRRRGVPRRTASQHQDPHLHQGGS